MKPEPWDAITPMSLRTADPSLCWGPSHEVMTATAARSPLSSLLRIFSFYKIHLLRKCYLQHTKRARYVDSKASVEKLIFKGQKNIFKRQKDKSLHSRLCSDLRLQYFLEPGVKCIIKIFGRFQLKSALEPNFFGYIFALGPKYFGYFLQQAA